MREKKKIIVAITGASGSIYPYYLLQSLADKQDLIDECCIVFSDNGKNVWEYELKMPFHYFQAEHFRYADNNNLFDAISSGSSAYDAMIIVPCSMGSIGRMATSISNDLISRSADVMLKEKRRLIIVPRESPYNTIHLQNMTALSQVGAMIVPASPFFYHYPETIEQLVLPFTERLLLYMDLPSCHFNWGER